MGSLFGSPKPPAIKPPAPAPTIDDEAIKRAKRKQLLSATQRSGRQSTILTDYGGGASDKLG